MDSDDARRLAREQAQASAADLVTVPSPERVTDLYPMASALDPELAVTRLGGESTRILPVWPTADGDDWTFVTADGPAKLPRHPGKDDTRALILSTSRSARPGSPVLEWALTRRPRGRTSWRSATSF
ncbi:hypothetical protein AB0F71_18275 [Kitasatospora sp. NPDC028055]|uniref:hypothetical protein n=1 Tax=Kitasatospora sp. NPDC028055 TaxID=3155653 RepID=UPI00340BAC1A